MRLVAALTFLALVIAPAPATAQETPLPKRLVDGLRGIFGDHPARAAHAKGILFEGAFEPDPAAERLTAAALFDAQVPAVVRFSNRPRIQGAAYPPAIWAPATAAAASPATAYACESP